MLGNKKKGKKSERIVSGINIDEYANKYETHSHTSPASKCAHQDGTAMAKAYKLAGYDGMIVTDHNWGGNTSIYRALPWEEWILRFSWGYEQARKFGEQNGLKVWFGYEAGYDGTDFLIIGVTPQRMEKIRRYRLWNASIPEQMDIIHEAGGIVIQAHPYRLGKHIPEVRLFPEYVDAIEGINAEHSNRLSRSHYNPEWNDQAIALANEFNLPITAGSDSHSIAILGGGILTKAPLNSPQDLISLLMSNEMYLLTDGEHIYDRYGQLLLDDSLDED